MQKPLQKEGDFQRLTRQQMQLAERLADIEQEDSDRCAGCGGEDCICCEYYHDRQKWVSPDELFAENEYYDESYYEREDENGDEDE